MLGSPRGDNAEPASCPRADAAAPGSVDHRRVNLVLSAIAVDRRARRPGDDRAASALERAPDQPVDERVLQCRQRRLACRGERNQPIRIVAAGMRYRQQYRQLAARLMDGWGWELAHDQG